MGEVEEEEKRKKKRGNERKRGRERERAKDQVNMATRQARSRLLFFSWKVQSSLLYFGSFLIRRSVDLLETSLVHPLCKVENAPRCVGSMYKDLLELMW